MEVYKSWKLFDSCMYIDHNNCELLEKQRKFFFVLLCVCVCGWLTKVKREEEKNTDRGPKH